MASTFGESRFLPHQRHTAVPTAGIYFYKSKSVIMPSHLYKAYQIEGERQSEFSNSLCISLSSSYSPSLSSKCTLIFCTFPFQVFGQNHYCKLQNFNFNKVSVCISILLLLVSEPVEPKLIYYLPIYCIHNLHRACGWCVSQRWSASKSVGQPC